MLIETLRFIVVTLADLLTGIFLLRFLLQWEGIAFHNPLGQFVIAATDWAVRPTRRVLPGLWGLDLPCLFLAWLTQLAAAILMVGLLGAGFSLESIGLLALLAVIACLRVMIYLIFGIVLVTAIMSWINPHAPMAPLFNALARPFLAPFRRFIPLVGGVDLSPLVLLIVLQVLLFVLHGFGVAILR